MTITKEHYERIADCFPRQRGNVSLDNLNVLDAILYVAENGCKWRRLPKEFGNWHSIYTRMNRWSKNGTLARIFERLQRERLISIKRMSGIHLAIQVFSKGYRPKQGKAGP